MLHNPNLDLLRVQDVGLRAVDDSEILAWAASNGRILLTHDRATMPDFAYKRLFSEDVMAGMFVVNDRMPVRQAIDELLLPTFRRLMDRKRYFIGYPETLTV
jgi:uncharacterized protein with PIN domain